MDFTRQSFLRSLILGGGAFTAFNQTPLIIPAFAEASDVSLAFTARRQAIGVYTGYGLLPEEAAANTRVFENIIGRPVDYLVDFGSDATWPEARGSAAHALRVWRLVATSAQRKLLWNQPLTVRDTPLEAVAAGHHDIMFQGLATLLRSTGFYDAVVRLGWDMNGSWVPWAAKPGAEAISVEAFRRVAGIFRQVSPSFRMCWSPARHQQILPPEQVYPGDDVVDYIGTQVLVPALPPGVDFDEYFERTIVGHGSAPIEGRLPYSLAWIAEFARAHRKPIVIAEYGIGASSTDGHPTGASFVQRMAEWIKRNEVAIHCWRDLPDGNSGGYHTRISRTSLLTGQKPKLEADEQPELALAFRNAWRNPASN